MEYLTPILINIFLNKSRALRSVSKPFNNVFLVSFSRSYTQCIGSAIIELHVMTTLEFSLFRSGTEVLPKIRKVLITVRDYPGELY